jgi:hypothetical protein
MHAISVRKGVVAPGSCLYTNGYSQPLPAVEMMPARGLEAHATGSHRERLQPGLTQRDMWVMHRVWK